MKPLRLLLVLTGSLLLSASPLAAQKGQVTCKDGTKSAGGRGACSGHGGIMTAATKTAEKADAKVAKTEKKAEEKVAKTERKAAAKVEKTEKKAAEKVAKTEAKGEEHEHEAAGAIAECKDHTYSHAKSHRGACSRHGGVAKFLDGKK